MSIAKSIKVGGKKLDLAYITPKEKELLLAKDRSVGDITKKFHKGIPALFAFTGADRGRDEGYAGSSGGLVGDIGDVGRGDGIDYEGVTYADITPGTWVGGKEGHMLSVPYSGMGDDKGYGHPGLKGTGVVTDLEPGGITETGARTVDHSPDLAYDDRGDGDPGSDAGGGRVTTGKGDEGSIGTDWTPEDEDTPHTPDSCAAAGGVWDPVTRSCIRKAPDISTSSGATSSPRDTGYGEDAPVEKAPRYKYRESTVKPETGLSETERVRAKVDAGTPLSVSVRDHLFGEATGVGSKYKRLADMDEDREFREKQLAQAQAFASKGMSFSTAQLDAETDMIRDAAKRRLITADEAAKLEHELKMSALRTAEPIELLAAAGKLGDAGYGGTFKPGAIDTSRFMDSDRFGLAKPPGFSGLPAEFEPDDVKEGKYTDSTGVTCEIVRTFKNADGEVMCPTSMPSGGGGGER